MKNEAIFEWRVVKLQGELKRIDHVCDFLKRQTQIALNNLNIDCGYTIDNIYNEAERIKEQVENASDEIANASCNIKYDLKWFNEYYFEN